MAATEVDNPELFTYTKGSTFWYHLWCQFGITA